jgi:hypothetical protein
MALGFDFPEIMDAHLDALSNRIRDMGTTGTHYVLQPIGQIAIHDQSSRASQIMARDRKA